MKNTIKLFVVSVLSFVAAGCARTNSPENDMRITRACTDLGGSTTLSASMKSSRPLPPNLKVYLNNRVLEVDECRGSSSDIQVNAERTEASVRFALDQDDELIKFYFPNGPNQMPAQSVASLLIESRHSCTDENASSTLIAEDLDISWENQFANGQDCGVSHHFGRTSLLISW